MEVCPPARGEEIILNLFFCGTSGSIHPPTTQVGLFSSLCDALPCEDSLEQALSNGPPYPQLKMSFDGCGTAFGWQGTLFATGLSEQCDRVVERVKELLAIGLTVKINCLGLSRGGMAILILVRKLSTSWKSTRSCFSSSPPLQSSQNNISVNALLFDPVPGNLIFSSTVDIFGQTLTSQCMDVSDCDVLTRVLALYPHEPLPDFAFHAPILPKYSEKCQVEEMVVLGCHQGALYSPLSDVACHLSYSIIFDFLTSVGTKFHRRILVPNKTDLLSELDHELGVHFPTQRYVHSYKNVVITRDEPTTDKSCYLNSYHRTLYEMKSGIEVPDPKYLLKIVPI
eukprot:TRINITY_DN7930_c0_g1_i2.p1 TRINITY_DN7930_c0_g1~~TRINITY_DN7930_c0_g1_i2.p1  ORF type:complete len:340 (-),score=46.04 TRINITY_DN7930_c0_g1_i2:116-1135(-)